MPPPAPGRRSLSFLFTYIHETHTLTNAHIYIYTYIRIYWRVYLLPNDDAGEDEGKEEAERRGKHEKIGL